MREAARGVLRGVCVFELIETALLDCYILFRLICGEAEVAEQGREGSGKERSRENLCLSKVPETNKNSSIRLRNILFMLICGETRGRSCRRQEKGLREAARGVPRGICVFQDVTCTRAYRNSSFR